MPAISLLPIASLLIMTVLGVGFLVLWRRQVDADYLAYWGAGWICIGLVRLLGEIESGGASGSLLTLLALMIGVWLQLIGAMRFKRWRVAHTTLWIVPATLCALSLVFKPDDSKVQLLGGGLLLVLNLVIGALLTRLSGPARFAGWLFILMAPIPLVTGITGFHALLAGYVAGDWQITATLTLRTAIAFSLMLASLDRMITEKLQSEQRYRDLTESSLHGILVVRRGIVLFVNQTLLRVLAYPDLEHLQGGYQQSLAPDSEQESESTRHERILDGRDKLAEWEGPRLAGDGTNRYLRFSSSRVPWDGGYAEQIVIADETDRHQAQSSARQLAELDTTTGLPNRFAFMQALTRACQAGGSFALILIDLARFQLINDAHGYATGDLVLHAVAERLRHDLRGSDLLARIGGDQFGILLTPHEVGNIPMFSQWILDSFRAPLRVQERTFFVDVSMGLASCPSDQQEAHALFNAADVALHSAKRIPGLSTASFNPAMNVASRQSHELEQALRKALQEDQITLFYQPKVDATTRQLVGFEALARWHTPDKGFIPPNLFIAEAERCGLISELGWRLLEMACSQIANWRSEYATVVPVAVNIAPAQLRAADFSARVLALLQAHQLPPSALELEVTESTAMENPEVARATMAALDQAGVRFSLDDFGTGHSSLATLRDFTLRQLKIDRSMITPLPASTATAVVSAVCSLGHALGMKIVAEGIETQEQADAVRDLGCNYLQGFLFDRPLPPDQAGERLRSLNTAG